MKLLCAYRFLMFNKRYQKKTTPWVLKNFKYILQQYLTLITKEKCDTHNGKLCIPFSLTSFFIRRYGIACLLVTVTMRFYIRNQEACVVSVENIQYCWLGEIDAQLCVTVKQIRFSSSSAVFKIIQVPIALYIPHSIYIYTKL